MFEISESYLEDEVRDGFYVPSMAKRAWAAELSILHEVNRICEKYEIKYLADWGTLLGAVRHRGFIPWDDDIDICMHRNELNKFLKVAESELPEGFRIHTFENNDYSWKFIVNIVNTERMTFTPEYLKSHFNFPYMATIDIFVLDNVFDDVDEEETRREKIKGILNKADLLPDNSIEEKRELYREVLSLLVSSDSEETEYIIQEIPWGVYHNMKYPRSYYEKIVRIPFEDTYICSPLLYTMLLTKKYGNFCEIRMGAAGHNYPYYKAQKQALGLREDEDYIPQYKFDRTLISETQGNTFVDGLDQRRQIVSNIEDYKDSKDYQGEFDRETVVFLPFKGQYWEGMRAFYEYELSRENVDVFVIPLPYFYKEYNGEFKEEAQYDLEAYPEDLPVYLYDEVDLDSLFADRIYIQNPYDEYNMCMSVPREYYASNIRNKTRKLIYIPWFKTADFEKDNYPQNYNMKNYCTMPGVVLADEVILNSKTLKERYVDKLCDFAGEDTRDIWERLITVYEGDSPASQDNSDVQQKKLLFYTSPSTIVEYGNKYIIKLNNCLDVFNTNKEKLGVIWVINKSEMEIIRQNDYETYLKLCDIRKQIIDSSDYDIEIAESEDGKILARECDAYYGDPSYIVKEFVYEKKPVMILSVLV